MAQEVVPATYQVFINHRGPETKKKLASLIYYRLINCGLRVFHDKDELRTGDTVCLGIRKAIRSVSIHICVFSELYAELRLCFAELCWILKSSHERAIIPVFCDVEPHDLLYGDQGHYAVAFGEHQRKGKVAVEVVKEWKEAFRKPTKISGLVFKTNESEHGECLEEIVKIVLREVKSDPLEAAKYPVGLDQALEDLQNVLGGLKVLIVLDDVDDRREIRSLLHLDGVGHGSLILITSRDKDLRKGTSADPLLYEVKPVKRKVAQELFCQHAFRQSKAFEGYQDLVEEFLEICGGCLYA